MGESQKILQVRSARQVPVRVRLLDDDIFNHSVDKRAVGWVLFDKVCEHLNIIERDYFGLDFYNAAGEKEWVNNDKKIAKQLKGQNWDFNFEVKFYPADPAQLAEDLTRYQLCLQIRRDIVNEKLPCSFVTYTLLGSYTAQSEVGDYDTEEFGSGYKYLKDIQFAPHQDKELLVKIAELHRQHKGETPEEAELHFLENAKKLAMYGVELHAAKDAEGRDIQLGVCASGLIVYKDKQQINRFVWPKVLKMSYRRNKFYIKIRPGEFETFASLIGFKLGNVKHAKRLWKICVEHHSFFRFREPETPKTVSFLPRFGSRFRYSGRTQFQTRQVVAEENRDSPYFDRVLSKRGTFGGRTQNMKKRDEERQQRRDDMRRQPPPQTKLPPSETRKEPPEPTRPPPEPKHAPPVAPKPDKPKPSPRGPPSVDDNASLDREHTGSLNDSFDDVPDRKSRLEKMHAVATPLAALMQAKKEHDEHEEEHHREEAQHRRDHHQRDNSHDDDHDRSYEHEVGKNRKTNQTNKVYKTDRAYRGKGDHYTQVNETNKVRKSKSMGDNFGKIKNSMFSYPSSSLESVSSHGDFSTSKDCNDAYNDKTGSVQNVGKNYKKSKIPESKHLSPSLSAEIIYSEIPKTQEIPKSHYDEIGPPKSEGIYAEIDEVKHQVEKMRKGKSKSNDLYAEITESNVKLPQSEKTESKIYGRKSKFYKDNQKSDSFKNTSNSSKTSITYKNKNEKQTTQNESLDSVTVNYETMDSSGSQSKDSQGSSPHDLLGAKPKDFAQMPVYAKINKQKKKANDVDAKNGADFTKGCTEDNKVVPNLNEGKNLKDELKMYILTPEKINRNSQSLKNTIHSENKEDGRSDLNDIHDYKNANLDKKPEVDSISPTISAETFGGETQKKTTEVSLQAAEYPDIEVSLHETELIKTPFKNDAIKYDSENDVSTTKYSKNIVKVLSLSSLEDGESVHNTSSVVSDPDQGIISELETEGVDMDIRKRVESSSLSCLYKLTFDGVSNNGVDSPNLDDEEFERLSAFSSSSSDLDLQKVIEDGEEVMETDYNVSVNDLAVNRQSVDDDLERFSTISTDSDEFDMPFKRNTPQYVTCLAVQEGTVKSPKNTKTNNNDKSIKGGRQEDYIVPVDGHETKKGGAGQMSLTPNNNDTAAAIQNQGEQKQGFAIDQENRLKGLYKTPSESHENIQNKSKPKSSFEIENYDEEPYSRHRFKTVEKEVESKDNSPEITATNDVTMDFFQKPKLVDGSSLHSPKCTLSNNEVLYGNQSKINDKHKSNEEGPNSEIDNIKLKSLSVDSRIAEEAYTPIKSDVNSNFNQDLSKDIEKIKKQLVFNPEDKENQETKVPIIKGGKVFIEKKINKEIEEESHSSSFGVVSEGAKETDKSNKDIVDKGTDEQLCDSRKHHQLAKPLSFPAGPSEMSATSEISKYYAIDNIDAPTVNEKILEIKQPDNRQHVSTQYKSEAFDAENRNILMNSENGPVVIKDSKVFAEKSDFNEMFGLPKCAASTELKVDEQHPFLETGKQDQDEETYKILTGNIRPFQLPKPEVQEDLLSKTNEKGFKKQPFVIASDRNVSLSDSVNNILHNSSEKSDKTYRDTKPADKFDDTLKQNPDASSIERDPVRQGKEQKTKILPGVIHMLNPCPSGWIEGGLKSATDKSPPKKKEKKSKYTVSVLDFEPQKITKSNDPSFSSLDSSFTDCQDNQTDIDKIEENASEQHDPRKLLENAQEVDLLCRRVWKKSIKGGKIIIQTGKQEDSDDDNKGNSTDDKSEESFEKDPLYEQQGIRDADKSSLGHGLNSGKYNVNKVVDECSAQRNESQTIDQIDMDDNSDLDNEGEIDGKEASKLIKRDYMSETDEMKAIKCETNSRDLSSELSESVQDIADDLLHEDATDCQKSENLQTENHPQSLHSKLESLGLGNVKIDENALNQQNLELHKIDFNVEETSDSDSDSGPSETDSESGDEIELACFEMPGLVINQESGGFISSETYNTNDAMQQFAIDCSFEDVKSYKMEGKELENASILCECNFLNSHDQRGKYCELHQTDIDKGVLHKCKVPDIIDDTPHIPVRSNLKAKAKSESNLSERRVRFEENLPVYKSSNNLGMRKHLFAHRTTKENDDEKMKYFEDFITCLFETEPRNIGLAHEKINDDASTDCMNDNITIGHNELQYENGTDGNDDLAVYKREAHYNLELGLSGVSGSKRELFYENALINDISTGYDITDDYRGLGFDKTVGAKMFKDDGRATEIDGQTFNEKVKGNNWESENDINAFKNDTKVNDTAHGDIITQDFQKEAGDNWKFDVDMALGKNKAFDDDKAQEDFSPAVFPNKSEDKPNNHDWTLRSSDKFSNDNFSSKKSPKIIKPILGGKPVSGAGPAQTLVSTQQRVDNNIPQVITVMRNGNQKKQVTDNTIPSIMITSPLGELISSGKIYGKGNHSSVTQSFSSSCVAELKTVCSNSTEEENDILDNKFEDDRSSRYEMSNPCSYAEDCSNDHVPEILPFSKTHASNSSESITPDVGLKRNPTEQVTKYTFSINEDSDSECPKIKTVTYEYVTEYKLNNVKIQYQQNRKTQTDRDVQAIQTWNDHTHGKDKIVDKLKQTNGQKKKTEENDSKIEIEEVIEKSVCYPLGPSHGKPSYDNMISAENENIEEQIEKHVTVLNSFKSRSTVDKDEKDELQDITRSTYCMNKDRGDKIIYNNGKDVLLTGDRKTKTFSPNFPSTNDKKIIEHNSKKYVWQSCQTKIPFQSNGETSNLHSNGDNFDEQAKLKKNWTFCDDGDSSSQGSVLKYSERNQDDHNKISINKAHKEGGLCHAEQKKSQYDRSTDKNKIVSNPGEETNGSTLQNLQDVVQGRERLRQFCKRKLLKRHRKIDESFQDEDLGLTISSGNGHKDELNVETEQTTDKRMIGRDLDTINSSAASEAQRGREDDQEETMMVALMQERLPEINIQDQEIETMFVVQAVAAVALGTVLMFLLPYVG